MSRDRYTYGNHVRVSMDNAGPALMEILNELTAEVRMGVNQGVRETTKEASKVTKDSGTYQNRRPKYRQSISWRFTTAGPMAEGQVYARGHEYSLTHLLENGHHLWNAPGVMTRAFKHWETGDKYANDNLAKNILKNIKI